MNYQTLFLYSEKQNDCKTTTGQKFRRGQKLRLTPDPGPTIFQIWESNSCGDSSYNYQSNLNLPMFLLKKWLPKRLLLPKLESDSGSGFSQIFDSGSWSRSETKTQNPAGVDSGCPDPVPPLCWIHQKQTTQFQNLNPAPNMFQNWVPSLIAEDSFNRKKNYDL